jgi:hypothetical protein
MANGMQMMLKAFGINITDAEIKALEEMLPKLPAYLAEAVSTIQRQAEQLTVIQNQQAEILRFLEEHYANTESRRVAGDGSRSGSARSGGRANGRVG